MSVHLRSGPRRKPVWLTGRRLVDLRRVRLLRDFVTAGGAQLAKGSELGVEHSWRGWLMLDGLRYVSPIDVDPIEWAAAKVTTEGMRTAFRCAACGLLTIGRLPREGRHVGDGSLWYSRRHDKDREPCPGNLREAQWVEVPLSTKLYGERRPRSVRDALA